jgi:hypothetical protein
VVYRYPNDVLLSFSSKQFGHGYDDILCRVYGTEGTADTHYFGAVTLKGKEDGFNGGVMQNLYTEGTVNNIAEFYRCVTEGDYSNPTVGESVRSNLTTILGRTAAYEKRSVTWREMMDKAEKWDAGLEGAKA